MKLEYLTKNPHIKLVNFYLDGQCNYSCPMCAYTHLRETYPKSDKALAETVAAQLETIIKKDNSQEFLICFIGGEPTYNFTLLEECFSVFNELRNKFWGKVHIAMTTNGYFGSNQELLSKIGQMKFDIIQLSCSLDHSANAQNIKNILQYEGIDQSCIWISTIGDKDEIYNLYKSKGVDISHENSLYYKIRKYYDLSQVYSKGDLLRIGIRPVGIFVTKNGIHPLCPGEATEYWCKITDSVHDIENAFEKLKGAEMHASFETKEQIYPICSTLKKCEVNCSCLDRSEVRVYLDENGKVQYENY